MTETSTNDELNNEQLLEYLKTIRENLARFEDLSLRLILQGIPVIIGLVTATSFLVKYSISASLGIIIGIIFFTLVLMRLSKLYVDLIWTCPTIASSLEMKLFKENVDWRLTHKIVEKIASKDEKGKLNFFKHKWDTVLFLTYIVLLAIESILLFIYLWLVLFGINQLD